MENRSFDGLYGSFPNVDGFVNAGAAKTQVDKDGKPYETLPPVLDSNNLDGNKQPSIDSRFPSTLLNGPFNIDQRAPGCTRTGDMVHRFYQEQQQIDGGKMDKFVAFTDSGALPMGYYDTSKLRLYKLAQQYTLADHFFHGAFGGSFLNHIELISGTAPVWKNSPAKLVAQLDAQNNLVKDGQVTPDGYAVNTTQPTYTPYKAGTAAENRLPPQTMPTIGDRLSDKGISWAWYAGGWNDAIAGKPDPLFQYHHQPFAYFQNYGDGTPGRAEHLKDEKDFLAAIANNTLPAVSFVKPIGQNNQHPGYADIITGDNWAADIIERIQYSPAWKETAIIVTYDENGGMWDHAAPPKVDRWGPGTRIPTLVISPYAKKRYIDHAVMYTDSIIRLIEKRFDLQPLGTRDQNAPDMLSSFNFNQTPSATP
jgi:phospholipase C